MQANSPIDYVRTLPSSVVQFEDLTSRFPGIQCGDWAMERHVSHNSRFWTLYSPMATTPKIYEMRQFMFFGAELNSCFKNDYLNAKILPSSETESIQKVCRQIQSHVSAPLETSIKLPYDWYISLSAGNTILV